MAAVNVSATNKTKIAAGGSGQNMLDMGMYAGVKKVMIDTYTLAAVEATSTIKVATPPAGSRIVGAKICHAALGSGVTLALGDSDDVDRYLIPTAANAVGMLDVLRVIGANYIIGTADGDDEMYLTVGTATGTGDVVVIIEYV